MAVGAMSMLPVDSRLMDDEIRSDCAQCEQENVFCRVVGRAGRYELELECEEGHRFLRDFETDAEAAAQTAAEQIQDDW
jgi:hypothetical protein